MKSNEEGLISNEGSSSVTADGSISAARTHAVLIDDAVLIDRAAMFDARTIASASREAGVDVDALIAHGRGARCFGRDQELAQLVELADGAIAADLGRVVVLEGEAGIGKSRLCSALVDELARRKLHVFEGRCRDGVHNAATYRPFVEILDAVTTSLDAMGEAGVAERGREVGESLAGRTALGAQGAGWAERRASLFDAVAEFLIDASRLLRLAILIHDVDLADRATRELVAHLAAIGAPAAPLATGVAGGHVRGAIILTARVVDGELLSGASVTSVRLRALDEEGVRAFLQSPEVVTFFAEVTGGRPRALEALLESAPLDIDELLRARWARLSDASQRLVAALAVAGRPMDLADLGQLTGLISSEKADALSRAALELASSRVVHRAVESGRIVFSFLRRSDEETIYSLLANDERVALHRAVGAWFAEQGRDDLLDRVRIAEHLLRGGAPTAVEAALHAADALELTYGYDRAIDLLRRARVVTPASGPIAIIDGRLCELERLVGDYDAALATAERIEAREPGAAARRRVAALHVVRDELDLALAALDTALVQTSTLEHGAEMERGRIAAARAEALYLAGRTQEAKRAAETALEHGDDPEAPARRLEIHNTLGKIALADGRYADAASIFGENVAPARALGNAFEESRALFNLGIAELRLGDHAQAQARYQAALEVAESAGDHRNRAFCLQNLAVLAHWRGDYAQALSQFQSAVAAFRRTGLRARLAWVALDLASVYLDLNDRDGAEATAALVEQLGTQAMPPKIGIDRALLTARIAALGGDFEGARRGAVHVERAAAGHQPERVIEAGQLLVRLDLDEGDLGEAARALDSLPMSRADRTQLRTDLLRAELHVARGRGLDARRLLRDALATAQRLADLESEWRAHYWLGRAALTLRDGTEAERRFRAALSVDRRLRERVPENQRAAFEADPLRRALERALGLPAVVALPVAARPRPRLVDGKNELVAEKAEDAPLVGRMVGRHPRMQTVSGLIARVAPSDSIVLIRGESGTGKELAAEALHEGSSRRGRPFIKVNCGAIVESLLLSELFGHERGAFTGAMARKKGRFEVADGGTLFLDEIGDVSPRTQVALLRVLQERQFERVGGTTPVRVDVRILCATHRNLEEMVARGEFREDLYYRLRGIQIELPALRERASDVPIIAAAILGNLAAQRGQDPLRLTDEAKVLLTRHAWPGNVRELENVLRSASLFADGGEIDARDLGELVASPRGALESCDRGAAPPAAQAPEPISIWQRLADEGLSLKELKTRVEVECIERALAASGGNITRAAEKLGMKRPRLSQLIKEHGLRAEENK